MALDTTTRLALAALTVFAAVALIANVRAWWTEGDPDSRGSALLVFVVGWFLSAPTVLGSIGGGLTRTYDVFGSPLTLRAAWVSQLDKYAGLALAGTCLVFVLRNLKRRGLTVTPLPLVAAALCTLGALVDIVTTAALPGLPQYLLVSALVAAAMSAPGRAALAGGAAFGISAALVTALAVATDPAGSTTTCRIDKCGPLGVLVPGPFAHENALGLVMALAAPIVLVACHRWPRTLFVSLLAVAAVSGSRSASLAAAMAGITALLLWRTSSDRVGHTRWSDRLAIVAVIVPAITSLAVPLLGLIERGLTGRPYLWQLARDRISEHLWTGNGALAWHRLSMSDGLVPRAGTYSTHNQWLDVLLATGLLGAVLFAALVLLPLRARPDRVAFAVVVAPALWAGILERAWSFGAADWLSWSLVAVALAFGTHPGDDRRRAVAAASENCPAQPSPVGALHMPQSERDTVLSG